MSSPPPAGQPLVIKKVRGMGRGVFAGRPFRRGEVIEVCPVLPLSPDVREESLGVLEHYVFKWGDDGDQLAVALGYGSLYNHSADANATFGWRISRNEIVFRATRPIAVGEQILINYQWTDEDYAAFS